ncbi:Small subunit ribosomal protein S27Ae [Fasciola hepatica]|uniref:Small subunit ribosomal protein S27Ae n=1 Tax=Fasciola hepatica TaxID=6192 RepID=A0A2H1C1D8_FASHE|nr:Small subunit ribosomal protein S27Ae [Fasciola hepatica]
MRLFVRSPFSGLLSFNVSPSDSVKSLVAHLDDSIDGWYLSHDGRLLEDTEIFGDLELEENACLDLNCELAGGAKKRKKKVYTTPKKTKHRNKKVKLATLKFYKVDSNGKITRLRRECPSEKCGAGIFMASHFDRQYCGKCMLTYRHASK